MLNPGGVQMACRKPEGNTPGLAAKQTFAACALALDASVRQRTHYKSRDRPDYVRWRTDLTFLFA
jgi:hypothetical protein